MIYSRLLYTEHEHPHNENGEGAYTIFSTQQTLDKNLNLIGEVYIQTFAVLWKGHPDTRLVELIEQSIIIGQLSPVKLLHVSSAVLTVVYDTELAGKKYENFKMMWERIAAGVMYGCWGVRFISEIEASFSFEGGRLLKIYARDILNNNNLGITSFTTELFLLNDNWQPKKIFGQDYLEVASSLEKFRDDSIIFYDDVDF
ncbi:hypothetical protein [Pseudomonas retamae]|uniref:Uncharacterized protein n=1 Tax=Pseudomonas retamae TaxID=702110 RepID=A0ABW7DHC5_9PSED